MIQQYEILDKLGSGGMGHVYKARDTRLHRIVAIKALAFGKLADDDVRRRFLQEARAASALNHPNIITIHDILTEDGADFLVMEYVSGKTLADLIPQDGMAVRDVLGYGAQIASALEAAHTAGVVHRDLKPGNIMVSDAGTVKVLDFGLAKQLDANREAVTALTMDGAVLGTAAYMSPEQAEGKKVDARSDIFSFGAILHEMITGRRAFPGESHVSILAAVLRDPPRRVSELVADVPAGFEDLLSRCLNKNPEARWRNTGDLRAALADLKSRQDPGVAAVSSRPAVPETTRKLPVLAVAVLALVLAAIGGLWWKVTRKPEPRVDPVMIPPVSRETDRPSPVAPLTPAPADPIVVPAPAIPKPAVKPVVLSDGYPIPLLLDTPVTKDLEAGAPLRFTVAADVAIHGARLVAKGAAAAGFVGPGKKRFLRGKSVTIGFDAVRAVDGKPVRLRAAAEAGKRTRTADTETTAYTAYVDGDVEIVPRP